MMASTRPASTRPEMLSNRRAPVLSTLPFTLLLLRACMQECRIVAVSQCWAVEMSCSGHRQHCLRSLCPWTTTKALWPHATWDGQLQTAGGGSSCTILARDTAIGANMGSNCF